MVPVKTVLVIDDDASIRDPLQLILEKSGFGVVTASSGKEGISKAAASKPDLVFCDMMMEDASAGFDAAQAIKKLYPKTPIVLISSIADSMEGNVDTFGSGFARTIQKPIDPSAAVQLAKKLTA